MAKDDEVKRWLDLLIEQTSFGNVQWREIARRDSYQCVLGDSVVLLETRDNDGMLPFVLSAGVIDDDFSEQWIIWGPNIEVQEFPSAAPEWLAMRARMLWDVIQSKFTSDPVTNMLTELEQMPPF